MDEPTTTQLLEQAQSTCTAWRDVFDCIAAHLRDRIEAGDEADPERYLRIIRSEVQNVARESEAIVNARWADAARARDEIGRVRSVNDAMLAALEAMVKPWAEGSDDDLRETHGTRDGIMDEEIIAVLAARAAIKLAKGPI